MRHIDLRFMLVVAPALLVAFLSGCGVKEQLGKDAPAKSVVPLVNDAGSTGNEPALEGVMYAGGGDGQGRARLLHGGEEPAGSGGAASGEPRKPALPRKLAYNADVQVIVPDLDEAKTKIHQAMKDHNALLTHEDASGATGLQRTGRWTLRVPTENFDAFLAAVGQLGHVERSTTKTQDVTEEFYDLKGRIAQKEVEAKGLEKLQEEAVAIMNKDPKARMEDVLAVRREWNSVRQELDRMQGRLRLLENLTELTTVTVSASERKNYVPPSAPTFGNRVSTTFGDSKDALVQFGEWLVLFAVAIAPWLPLFLVVVIPMWLLVRRATRRGGPTPKPVTPAPSPSGGG